jgi:Protein of unknown function (DUF2877)
VVAQSPESDQAGIVAVSAPVRVADHLRHAPDGPVAVLHRSRAALYVEVAGRCIGVVGTEAAQVPCALRLSTGSSGVSPAQVLADERLTPYVERGTLYLTGYPLRIGRFVDVRVPRIDPSRVLRAASPATAVARPPRPAAGGVGLAAHSAGSWPGDDGLGSLGEGYPVSRGFLHKGPQTVRDTPPRPQSRVGEGFETLPAELPADIDAGLLHQLVGNGGGLTPLGDDVLCGWLAVLVATGRLTDAVTDAVRAVLDRTTLLSATLIDCALHGEVLPEFAAYVRSLGTPDEEAAAGDLTAIGHTSGAGLWWGAQHALTSLAAEEAA